MGKAKILFPLIASLVITAAYAPTFSGEFILDDMPLVKNNLFIRELKNPTFYLFQEDGVYDKSPPDYHTGYYRPLVSVFYALDYKMWGMNPSGFRVTNFILHLFTCIVLYQLLAMLFDGSFIPFLVTLLFGLHPVNTESVSWISSRNNILVTLFSLISFYSYIKEKSEGSIWYRVLSYVSFAMALLCKEFAIMLFPIFFLYHRLMGNNKKICKDEMVGYIPFILLLLFYFMLRANAIGSLLTPISTPHLWKNLYFVPFLIIYNLKLILIPYRLHSFIIQYPENYFNWKAFAGFVCLIILAFFLVKERKHTILLFSFFAFLVALFPVLNIVHTSAVTIVSMRWLYFPMIFLTFSCAWYLEKLFKGNRFLIMSSLGVIIVYFGVYSYLLNQHLWHNEKAFFKQEIFHFNNILYAGGLAEHLFHEKKLGEAEGYFRMAINYSPYEAKNYLNYSALFIDTKRPNAAVRCLNKAKGLPMTRNERGQWFNNVGMAYFRLNKKNQAIINFKKAVIFSPKDAQFWANLGGAYGSIGDYENSVFSLKKGLNIAPESIQLRKNLAITYMNMGNFKKAAVTLEKIPLQQREQDREVTILLKKAREKLPMRHN